MTIEKYEEAEKRFHVLVKVAKEAPDGGGSGPLTMADHDELSMLAGFLGQRLPKNVHALLTAEYPYESHRQRRLGERIERAVRVIEKYGDAMAPETGNELLPSFTLDKKDKEKVLELCNGMRKIIFASIDFDEPHKKRLLNRIAAIEGQVMSPRGLFDVVLGGVSDVGETLNKFGKDIKPLTDRMAEVVKITRKGTKEYDQIPAPEDLKRLPAPTETEED